MQVCGAVAVVALLSGAVAAQDKKPLVEALGTTDSGPLPPGGATPRMSDGKPDLSGIWFAGVIGRPSAWSRTPPERIVEDPVPFRPEVATKLKSMSRAELAAADPTVNCLPRGVPGMFTMNPHPSELVTMPGTFIQLVEAGNQWRKVFTNKRPHPEYPDPLFNGNSSAWWEGDTLIIDSVGFDERTWITGSGWYHSIVELPGIPVHGDGSEGSHEELDVWMAQVHAGPRRRQVARELLHERTEFRAVPEARRAGEGRKEVVRFA
jgi:hypothetical protein